MGLVLGDLAAIIRVDDRPMEEGMDQARQRFAKFGDKLQAGAAVIGAAAGAALAAGIATTMEMGAANDKLAAQLGATPEMARELGEIAGDLYANAYGESMEQVNEAIRGVIQAGAVMEDASKEQIESVTASVLDLATAFEQDLGATSRAVGKMIKTGMAKDATEALDLLTRGFQQGTDEAGDLLDTVSEYSTKFRDIGLGGAQALGLLSQGLHAGARDADTVADALKEFAIIATEGPEAAVEAFKSLGLNAKKMTADIAAGGPRAAAALDQTLDRLRAMKDPVERNALAVALFGTKAEDLGDALFALDPSSAVQALGDVEGAAKKMGATLADNASTNLEVFKRKAQQALVEKLAAAVPYIEKTFGWLAAHSDWVVPLATGLGAFAAAIYTISIAMKAWAVIQTVLNMALWTSPITWIVLGIIALVAVIVLIALKTTWFQDLWRVVWGGIKSAAGAVWDWISGTLWPGIKAVFTGIGDVALWLWHNAIEPAWNGIMAVIDFVVRIVTSYAALMAWAFKVTVGEPVLWLWHNAVEPAAQGIAAAAMWLWNNVLSPTFNAIGAGARAVGAAAMWLWHNAIEPAMHGVAAVATWAWNNVISPTFNAISGAAQRVGDVVRDVFSRVGGWISAAFSGAAGIVKGAMNGVIRAINSAISGINSVIGKANKIPGVDFPTIPNIPMLARGGVVTRGGRAVVGERGAEVVDLPTGAAVYPHGTGPAGGITVEHLEVKAYSDRFSVTQVQQELAMHGVH